MFYSVDLAKILYLTYSYLKYFPEMQNIRMAENYSYIAQYLM